MVITFDMGFSGFGFVDDELVIGLPKSRETEEGDIWRQIYC